MSHASLLVVCAVAFVGLCLGTSWASATLVKGAFAPVTQALQVRR